MLRFDFVDLSLFRHIAEAGSITAGAERAHLALAAASVRIKNLERDLGAALLVRSRSGVVPTPAGRTFLQHARTILAGAERLREDISAFAGGAAGEVRLLSNTNAIVEFLPDVLGAFLAQHPRISVDLEERLSDEIVAMVAEGVADVGIVAATVATAGLTTYPFRTDRFTVVVGDGHRLAGRDAVAFADVVDEDFVGLDRSSALQRFLGARAAAAGRTLKLRVQLRSFDAVCRLVAAGAGIGIVPETTARRAARGLAMSVVALSDPWAARDLTICTRAMADLPPSARLLVEHLRVAPPARPDGEAD